MRFSASTIGAGVGGGIGGYLSWLLTNDLYAGFGAGAGALVGGLIGWLFYIWRWRHPKKPDRTERSNDAMHRIANKSGSR